MRSICAGIIVTVVLMCMPVPLFSAVSGECVHCHTMHNSQDGTAVSDRGPWRYLLSVPDTGVETTDICVACHSSVTNQTIVGNIPVVFNTTKPLQPLAGGNFYWVVSNGDAYGHNVRGISEQDAVLDFAPGSTSIQIGCGDSCHKSLALPDYDKSGNYNNGCEGCHQSVNHHGSHPEGEPVPPSAGWYRFLSSPPGHMTSVGGGGVYGIEDPDWEHNATSSTHNIHYGGDSTVPSAPDFFESITAFCAGCHFEFHAPGFPYFGIDNGGGGGPWLRHPTDVAIPDQGEFAPVIGTPYDPVVPVGKPDLMSLDPSLVEDGDKVICLSCHRAHGSDQPDMLRWDYNEMIAGTEGSAAGTGCFKCHTEKDGI